MTEPHFDDAAVDRLHGDALALEDAVLALRDSIAGQAGVPNGGVYATHVAYAAQVALQTVGRLANTLDKAASELRRRASAAYLDFLGEGTDATEQVRGLAAGLRAYAKALTGYDRAAQDLISRLSAVGQR